MKALAFVRRDTNPAISILRTLWPFRELNRHGHTCRFVDAQTMPKLLTSTQEETDKMIGGFDLYVMSRVLGPGDCPLQDYKDKGAKVVLEVDDDLTDETRVWGLAPYLDQVASWCDAITTSSEHLSALMRKRYHKRTFTLPNFLDTSFFAKVSAEAERVFEGLTIGLLGTGTHWFDWEEVLDALIKIRVHYPKVNIIAAGCYPEYLRHVPDIQFVQGLPFDQYPALVRQVDIRLIPLAADNKFNASKSPVAAMEAMASARAVGDGVGGAVPVCSDHPVYKELVRPDTGVIVENGQWYEAIAELIEDQARRETLARMGNTWVQANCDISFGYKLWEKSYRSILGGKNNCISVSDTGNNNVLRGQFCGKNTQPARVGHSKRRVLGKSQTSGRRRRSRPRPRTVD